MTTSLSDIRFQIERNVKASCENEDVINWCNYVNSDVGMAINIPSASPAEITLTTTDLAYTLPADLKIINRLRLQSSIDEGIDAEFIVSYRIYNGQIVLPRYLWIAPDTLIIDYYKHMTLFTDIEDEIDIDDRFAPLYTFYGIAKTKGHEPTQDVGYLNMKTQLLAYYSLRIEPVVIQGRWGR